MKKTMIAFAGLLSLSLAACSGQTDCTQDVMTKKTKELSDAITASVAKDPAKGAAFMAKMQTIIGKFTGSSATSPEACKAVDELIKAAKE
jgi:outer membrane lipoprotein SlyB